MKQIEATKLALEALEDMHIVELAIEDLQNWNKAVKFLRQAIAEVEPQKSPWAEYWKGLLAENEALRHRLAEAEKQESVVRYFEQWQASPLEEVDEERFNKLPESVRFKLYEAPQQPSTIARTWVGLTPEDIDKAKEDNMRFGGFRVVGFAYDLEQVLKERNTNV